jgi:hypothetical protein
MHSTDFFKDLDASKPTEVAEAQALDVGIEDGLQTSPPPSTTDSANRLLVFTGTAVCEVPADGDGELSRGVVRVKLNSPLPASQQFVGSASVAGLASVHGSDDTDAVFAADAVKTVHGPTDGGTLPGNGLPEDDLYVIIDAATQGPETLLSRIAYQANVLVKDTEPDLVSILVKPEGFGVFAPEADIASGANWDFQINLSGPVLDPTFLVLLQSSDPNAAPVAAATQLTTGQTSASFFGGTAKTSVRPEETVTITAVGRRGTKTATLVITPPPA